MSTTETSVPAGYSKIDSPKLKSAALVLRAMNHKLRQQILTKISETGTTNVSSIYKSMGLEQSVASQHLAILRKAGIVNTSRQGKEIFYSVNNDRIDFLMTKVLEII